MLQDRSLLSFSLRFVRCSQTAAARAALPRHVVQRVLINSIVRERPCEIGIRLVDQAQGQELNARYRNRGYATNVLTFAYTQSPVLAADLVLCMPVIAKEAAERGTALQDYYAHMLVHGTLHAQGYDHEIGEVEAVRMEYLENAIMRRLGYAAPYG